VTSVLSASILSLVIPTYNRGPLIGETIDSALRQTTPFLEIIVVDDGSTDNTSEVLASYGDSIRVIKMAKGGVQRARNTGVADAKGSYVVLCDSDDLLEPEYVSTVSAWLTANPGCDAIYSNFVTFNEDGVQADKFLSAPAGFFDQAICTGCFWHDIPDLYVRTVAFQALFVSGAAVRKSVYVNIGGFDTRINGIGSEDWEFTLRLIANSQIALCATPLVRIRKHNGNESADSMRQVRGTVQILEFALAQHPMAQVYRDAILNSIDQRRVDVFNGAFARGEFDLAGNMLSLLHPAARGRAFQLKAFITRLPHLLRKPLWRISQAS
jgi:glycosyltransferase involved in cell wall biosynthesis